MQTDIEIEDSKLSKPKLLYFLFIILTAVIALGFLVYQYIYDGDVLDDIPFIEASEKQIKHRPLNPGGMEIKNTDKRIYDYVTDSEIDIDKNSQLLPEQEKPVDVERVTDESNYIQKNKNIESKIKESDNLIDKAKTIFADDENDQINKEEILIEEKTQDVQSEPLNSDEKQELNNSQSQTSEPESEKTEIIDAPQNIETDEVIQIEKVNNYSSLSALKKEIYKEEKFFTVQLASLKNKQAAENEWLRLSNKYSFLKNYPYIVSKQAKFYALKLGKFEKESDAANICKHLAKIGQDCMIIEEITK